jgi:predicted DNA-binding transcriptional regulator AlpA
MAASTIPEFCRQHGISTPTYYKLRADGLGPREMRLGAAVRISDEAAAEWRRARENPQGPEAEEVRRRAESMAERGRAAGKSGGLAKASG